MRRGLILMMALTGLLWGQLVPTRFSLYKAAIDSTASYMVDSTSHAGLASNRILDIRAAGDSLLFFGTSRGLSLTPDLGTTFRSYIAEDANLPLGGISAMEVIDSLVAVAGLADTLLGNERAHLGRGLAYSTDMGNTWAYLPQPKEDKDSGEFVTFTWAGNTVRQLAITTSIGNATYDVVIFQEAIWAVSWYGGLRRYDLEHRQWTPVPLPRDGDTTFSSLNIPEDYELNSREPKDGGNNNHRAFSVIAHDSVIWVGTGAGINKGVVGPATDAITWTHYTSQRDGLPGNWVVALHHQVVDGIERIWAATWATPNSAESRGVCYTEDGGRTWKVALVGQKAQNFASYGKAVYVATGNGLYKSEDGMNWALFSSAVDQLTGEQVWAEETYGVLYDSRDSSLWIGTPDGLARTRDAGVSWEIERSFVSTTTPGEARFYAYPNPFYLVEDNFRDGSGHVRFQYHIDAGEIGATVTARISINDFAMDPVTSLSREHTIAGDFSQVWDGRNDAGHQVANGVYYCRLTIGQTENWTKVMVIK